MDLRSHLQLPSVSSQALDQYTSAGSILLVSIKETVAGAVTAFSSSRITDTHVQSMTQVTVHHIFKMKSLPTRHSSVSVRRTVKSMERRFIDPEIIKCSLYFFKLSFWG